MKQIRPNCNYIMLVYLFVLIVFKQWLTNQFSLKYYGHFPVTAAIPYNLPLPTKGTDKLSLFALSFLPVNSIFSDIQSVQ